MITAVLFDLDETLVDRHRTMHQFLVSQQSRFSLADSFVDKTLHFQKNGYADKLQAYARSCASLGIKDSGFPEILFNDFKERYGIDAVVFEGTIEVISALSHQFKLGIVSNGRSKSQLAKIEKTGLAHYFSAVIISENFGEKKPKLSIFKECLLQLKTTADRAMFVGDHPGNDITPAISLGMKTIWMRNKHFSSPQNCEAIAESIDQIPQIIADFNR